MGRFGVEAKNVDLAVRVRAPDELALRIEHDAARTPVRELALRAAVALAEFIPNVEFDPAIPGAIVGRRGRLIAPTGQTR